jgi:UDP-N-acetylglucosamine:LPS N-acetylglucosamine transferase
LSASNKKRVLVAVLDWGLGHAGRSILLITALLEQGAEVIMAGNGRSGLLLQKSFPELPFLECPAYSVHYRDRNFYRSMFRQLPKIFRAAFLEYRWLQKIIRDHRIDIVISDSRFGCFSPAVPSIMLSHQLNLPLSPVWLSTLVNFFYRRILRQFDEIWVPDSPDGLSGRLSYPSPFKNTHYVGWLSRFEAASASLHWDLLVLLSGPEPARTRLEKSIRSELSGLSELRVLLVLGKTDSEQEHYLTNHHKIVSYLSGKDLEEAIAGAAVVFCRSGYSSLMELASMKKKAILLPTPGQPEQEYLAERCSIQGWAVVMSQLSIGSAMEVVRQPERKIGFPVAGASGKLQLNVRRLLERL